MITSADNPKIKLARALLERRGRQQQGQCLAEGLRLIEDAMRAGIRPALIFFTAVAAETGRDQDLLARAAELGVPLWEVSPSVFATLSDTVTSQGLIAVMPIPALPQPLHPRLVLVLDQVRDPGNLGTILRGADAAGVDLTLLLLGCADPWSPKVLRSGMGAQFRLPLAANRSWTDVATQLAGRPAWLADAHGEYLYDQVDWTQPSALIINGETTGPNAAGLQMCRGRVAIPMPGDAESLNVAMATTVLLFEAVRQRRYAAVIAQSAP
jgi:RNA methyltransferase, TrmH family